MTLRQWLVHLRNWLQMFPLREHSWTSLLGEPEEECFTCGATRQDPDWTPEDRVKAQAFYARYPELEGEEDSKV